MPSWKKKNPPPSYGHWGFLRAWCAPLRGKLSLCFPYASRVQTCTILVALTKENGGLDPKTFAKIWSALVLLTLLARVDCRGWKFVFSSYCFPDYWQQQTWTEPNPGIREPMFKF